MLNQKIKQMKSCYQIPNVQTIWDHGVSVRDHILDLINFIENDFTHSKFEWIIPDSIKNNKKNILTYLLDKPTLARYGLFHDIGKPECMEVDEFG